MTKLQIFSRGIKSILLLGALAAVTLSLNGCALFTSLGECAAEVRNPTVMAALDSFESAGMAIRLSNHILQDVPIAEWDEWPSKMFGAPSAEGMLKMGVALVGSSKGVTIPTEIDPETGFPRPTSALYLFLREREKLIEGLNNKPYKNYFLRNQKEIVVEPQKLRLRPPQNVTVVNPLVYKNVLWAYGTVTSNKEAVAEMQAEIDRMSKGYKSCSLFLNKSTETNSEKFEALKKGACPDQSMKDDVAKAKLQSKVGEKQEEKDQYEKAYGKLATRVHKASVAGVDFSAAATAKLVCAIINGVRAIPNMQKEFSGLKGAYNILTLQTRAKNTLKSLGIFKDHIGFQWTVYKTMYQQIKGTYKLEDDTPTKQALERAKAVEVALSEIEPRIQLALAGQPVDLTGDLSRMTALLNSFPDADSLNEKLLVALQ